MKRSVCLATYNGSKYITEQLNSILIQLSELDEVIIGDDGSTDNTIELIEQLGDKRIKIIRNNFQNHVKNFNVILQKATGDIIYLSDQDDIWVLNKVKTCEEYLNNYDMVISDCLYVDKDLNILIDGKFNENQIQKLNQYETILPLILFTSPPHLGCCMCFKVKNLKYILPIPNYIKAHDRWIGFISRFSGKVHYIPEKLILFRRHDRNLSINKEVDIAITGKSNLNTYSKAKRRAMLIIQIIIRVIKVRLFKN